MSPTLSTLSICVDPRIELLTVIQSFVSKYHGNLTRYDLTYKEHAREFFSAVEDHFAVNLFEEIIADGSISNAYPTLMLYLSAPPELRLLSKPPESVERALLGESKMKEFIAAMCDFAKTGNFEHFMNEQAAFFERICQEVKEVVSSESTVQVLEDYFGWRENSYNLILSPLLHHGGYGLRLSREDGKLDLYSIIGPIGAELGHPRFLGSEGLEYIWHEFSHSFVNPVTPEFRGKFTEFESLYTPIAEEMNRQGYRSWEICLNEHIIRAITTRLAYREFGGEAGDSAPEKERGRSFEYGGSFVRVSGYV